MDLLVNDLSIHEQFHDTASFRTALGRLMAMRATARRFGREIHCCRGLAAATPFPGITMQQAVGRLDPSAQRAVMRWMTRGGPFWDDLRRHDGGDWLECEGNIVTDTAVGEAAFREICGVDCGLASIKPSVWEISPVRVVWRREDEGLEDRKAVVGNWLDEEVLEEKLRNVPAPITSWDLLRVASGVRFERLIFSEDCFQPLAGVPFSRSAAERLLALLDALERLALAFSADGKRTAEGQRIYRDHFTGDCAWFSGSSESEARNFRKEMTFPHPDAGDQTLFCPWHGKVRHMTLRIHFSWPIEAGKPVYVVYTGPKLTKR